MRIEGKSVIFGAWLICLFWAGDAVASYNPSTGRWLSRDPIGEKGRKNIYGFLKNDAIQRIDALGLFFSCTPNYQCKSVTVTFDDGGNSFSWHWIPEQDANNARFGTTMHVRWEVSGPPDKCAYHQNETGQFTFLNLLGPGGYSASWSVHTASQDYPDKAGVVFHSPTDDGTWISVMAVPPTITLECVSSNGTKVQQPINV